MHSDRQSERLDAIRVCIVENDDAYRGALRILFEGEPGYECIGDWATAEMAARRIPLLKPDVALVDLRLPRMTGVELIKELEKSAPGTKTIVLSVLADEATIFHALESGASGYLQKPATPLQVLNAVQEVRVGGGPMSAEIARLVISRFHQRGQKIKDLEVLSSRELEILQKLADGLSDAEIAGTLGIAKKTVSSHVGHIYQKLKVNNRAGAVARLLGN